VAAVPVHSEQRYRCLFDRFNRDVYAYCRRRTDFHTASDAAAETFLVAWRRIDDVPDGDAALGWLYGVARRVLSNEFRSDRRRRGLLNSLRRSGSESAPAPDVVVVRREQDRQVLAAMSRTRPEDQELLRLALWEGLAHAEIAEMLGCSTQAATQRIYRATRRVAREYRRLDHSEAVAGARKQLGGGEVS
jgi:RNA polymerase sigma-70 factor (ECF subfamily)